jgi:hypothetical protein
MIDSPPEAMLERLLHFYEILEPSKYNSLCIIVLAKFHGSVY